MPIKFYLQPNPVTPDPNDQSARVVPNQTIFFDEVTDQVSGGNNVV